MPPENSCGYRSTRCAACVMPTLSSIWIATLRAAVRLSRALALLFRPSRPGSWAATCSATSTICSLMRNTGFRLVVGSWKIMPMRRPRSARRVASSALSRSCPSNRISPCTYSAGGEGNKRETDRPVTDLPQPVSPTSPHTSPRSTARSMPLRICAWPSNERIMRCRFLISSSAIVLPARSRVQHIAQAVPQ